MSCIYYILIFIYLFHCVMKCVHPFSVRSHMSVSIFFCCHELCSYECFNPCFLFQSELSTEAEPVGYVQRHTSLYCALLYCTWQILHVFQIEGLCTLALSKSMGTIFHQHLLVSCSWVTCW